MCVQTNLNAHWLSEVAILTCVIVRFPGIFVYIFFFLYCIHCVNKVFRPPSEVNFYMQQCGRTAYVKTVMAILSQKTFDFIENIIFVT